MTFPEVFTTCPGSLSFRVYVYIYIYTSIVLLRVITRHCALGTGKKKEGEKRQLSRRLAVARLASKLFRWARIGALEKKLKKSLGVEDTKNRARTEESRRARAGF